MAGDVLLRPLIVDLATPWRRPGGDIIWPRVPFPRMRRNTNRAWKWPSGTTNEVDREWIITERHCCPAILSKTQPIYKKPSVCT